jgi:hypothetical protein
MGILDNILINFSQPLTAGSETLAAKARTAEAEGGGPRPCSRCGGRLFWQDIGGAIHCIVCNEPPDAILIQDYFFVKEGEGNYFATKLFLNPRETFTLRESPRHCRKVPRWSLPAEPWRCGEWADGLGLQGVWACDRANPGQETAFVRVDIEPSGLAMQRGW